MVTDGTGQAVSLNAYYPFGASKYASGARPTDMDFTGQRLDATGLNFYNARYYDSAIGRFVSADTIVADPGGSQGFNRYAYVRNNPMRYTDPSGHFLQCTSSGSCYDDGYSTSNPSFTSSDADERREQLLAYNNNLYEWAHKGWITDLEAFAQLADYAASMIPNNYAGNRTDAFVYDMASVLTEIEGATYYSRAKKLGETGFDWVFQDPGTGGEQPHHFWAYVAYTLKYGSDMARAGNLAHETFLARPYRGALKGRSYQDYALGRQGVSLEVDLIWGALEIDQVGDYISNNLAPGGVAATYWQNASDKIGNYSMLLAIASLIWPIPPGEQGR